MFHILKYCGNYSIIYIIIKIDSCGDVCIIIFMWAIQVQKSLFSNVVRDGVCLQDMSHVLVSAFRSEHGVQLVTTKNYTIWKDRARRSGNGHLRTRNLIENNFNQKYGTCICFNCIASWEIYVVALTLCDLNTY